MPAFTLLLYVSAIAQDVHHIADSIRMRRRVPGLVYAVISSDKILQSGAAGFKQLRGKDSISISNRFHIGNATASFTAFIAAQLVAKGKIVWTTRLIQQLPLLAKKARPEYKSITLVDLLSQQAGFPSFNIYTDFANVPVHSGTLAVQRYKLVEWLVLQPSKIDTTVKRTAKFSNANTAVAVAMLERASGKSWEELVREYLNKPLGISIKTGWPNKLSPAEPWGHWDEGDRFTPLDPNHWFTIPGTFTGAADANITLGDYIKFIQDELRGLRGQKAVFPARTYDLMHYAYPNYAIGWANLEVANNHISECDGTMGTFYSHVEIIKEKNIAVIVMANAGDNSAKGACLNLARMLREMYVRF